MEAGDDRLIEEAIYRACVAAGIRHFRPDSRAAAQQSTLAGGLLTRWCDLRGRDWLRAGGVAARE
jgi:hypothetical protein